MPTDADRRELFAALERSLGAAPAATLMELLPPVSWTELATKADLAAQGTALRGEIAELRSKVDGLVARQLVANVPLMFGVAGLVLAAAKLA